jgi:hypothetical protein
MQIKSSYSLRMFGKYKGISLVEYLLPSVLLLMGSIAVILPVNDNFKSQINCMWNLTNNAPSSAPNLSLLANEANVNNNNATPKTTESPVATGKTYCNANNECLTVPPDSLIETAATFGETNRFIESNADLLTQLSEVAKTKNLSPQLQDALYWIANASHKMGVNAGMLEQALGNNFKTGEVITSSDSRYTFVKDKIKELSSLQDTRDPNNNFAWGASTIGSYYAMSTDYINWIENTPSLRDELESLPGGKALVTKAFNTVYHITRDLNYQVLANGDIVVNVSPTSQQDHHSGDIVCSVGGNNTTCKP